MPNLFVADKVKFFDSVDTLGINEIKGLAKLPFPVLNKHRESIIHEHNNLTAVLKNDDNQQSSRKYCFYTALMLKNYYDGYSPGSPTAIKYSDLCMVLEKQLNNEVVTAPKTETLLETLASDLSALAKTPFSNSKLRALDGKANIHRLSTRFSMITVQQSLLLARQYHFLDSLERMMGRQVNIAILSAPLGVYNALSVGLFGIRFSLNLALIVKHTFMPTPEEAMLTMFDRFYEEIKKRHFQMTNDIVWGIINGLTNYAAYFHIAAPVASYLLIGFTGFDVIWLNYLLYQMDKSYKAKKTEYKNILNELIKGSEAYNLVEKQLLQLALDHEKARAEVVFYIAAASIMLGSFTAVFLLAPPVLVPLCFLICNIAIAMYLSGGEYGAYSEKCLVVEQLKAQNLDVTAAEKERNEAWNHLGFTIAKNTVMPLLIMGAFTVNFPAAIVLTLGYMAYESGYLMRLPELFVGKEEASVGWALAQH